MISEGSLEINALKQRLAAAKAQAQNASTMMESALVIDQTATKMLKTARKNITTARVNLMSSTQEVKAARALLKDAEKRWEVIDVDDASAESLENVSSKKRRKVSMSPEVTNGEYISTIQAFGHASDGRVANHGRAVSATNNGATTHQSNNNGNTINPVEQFIVGGCGLFEVNGAYSRCGRLHDGVSVYTKVGQWKGNAVNFALFRIRKGCWAIGIWTMDMRGDPTTSLYQCSKDGWIAENEGVYPAPRFCNPKNTGISGLVDEVVVEGCGISGANGAYARIVGQLSYGAPMYMKEGRWKGNTVDFVIRRASSRQKDRAFWCICTSRAIGSKSTGFYYAYSNIYTVAPPESGWILTKNGVGPAPTLRLSQRSMAIAVSFF